MTPSTNRKDRTHVYGRGLFLAHLVLSVFCLTGSFILGKADKSGPLTAQFAFSLVIATVMLIPIMAVVWAYFRRPVNTGQVTLYMLGHIGLVIAGYAGIYSMLPYGGESCGSGPLVDLYFSIVTFTTLGYGDCAPQGMTRGFAATQALLSYIFVGVVVGLFANINRQSDPDRGQGRP